MPSDGPHLRLNHQHTETTAVANERCNHDDKTMAGGNTTAGAYYESGLVAESAELADPSSEFAQKQSDGCGFQLRRGVQET